MAKIDKVPTLKLDKVALLICKKPETPKLKKKQKKTSNTWEKERDDRGKQCQKREQQINSRTVYNNRKMKKN